MTAFESLATDWGIHVDDEDRATYRALVEEMQAGLAAVAEEQAPTFELLHGSPQRYGERGGGWTPDEEADPLNAWLHRCRIEGAADGPLDDLDVGIKDNIAVADLPCTAGSHAIAGFVPEIDATVVARLLDAGATLRGKQNMDAFAMGDAGELGEFGPTRNPHDRERLAGGSSSGSAAAVAAGDCDASLGTDQAGSVRTPAAWCGVVGCKPTYGAVPYTGVFGMDFGFDHVGVLADDVHTNARVMEAIAGDDRQDGCRLDPRQPRGHDGTGYVESIGSPVDELTVGVLEEGFGWPTAESGVEATVRDAVDELAAKGVTVRTVSAPTHSLVPALVGVAASLGAAATYRQGGVGTTAGGWHWTGGRAAFGEAIADAPDSLSPAVVASLLFAAACRDDFESYGHAKNVALGLGREYDRCLAACDALAMPTVPQVAVEYRADADVSDRVGRLSTLPVNTGGANQTGHPAISVPCGTSDELPVGLQLLGRRFEEGTLYRLAAAVERSADDGP